MLNLASQSSDNCFHFIFLNRVVRATSTFVFFTFFSSSFVLAEFMKMYSKVRDIIWATYLRLLCSKNIKHSNLFSNMSRDYFWMNIQLGNIRSFFLSHTLKIKLRMLVYCLYNVHRLNLIKTYGRIYCDPVLRNLPNSRLLTK